VWGVGTFCAAAAPTGAGGFCAATDTAVIAAANAAAMPILFICVI
jgi:hypothetical protein